ncbi:hypothetical protein CEXT_310371 [Caerostris extrusa]|uniref:Uncharacterized protein n=1 Tax=Caerostris extrusa TaxID=172846 RepID=A0AAV4V015_CAEEX|nr:hypothetical protein CEXT_310371 [Caerostris extrusa]
MESSCLPKQELPNNDTELCNFRLNVKNDRETAPFIKPLKDLQKVKTPPERIGTDFQFQPLENDNTAMQVEHTTEILPRLPPLMIHHPDNLKELLKALNESFTNNIDMNLTRDVVNCFPDSHDIQNKHLQN